GEVELDGVSLLWFEPALEMRGLRVSPEQGSLSLRRARASFSFEGVRGFSLRRVVLEGGSVRLQPSLQKMMSEILARTRTRPAAGQPAPFPRIEVRDVAIELSSSTLGRLPLGVVDLVVEAGEHGAPSLTGRLVPSLASLADRGTQPQRTVITLAGKQAFPGTFEVRAWAAHVPLATEAVPGGTPV